MTRHSYHQVSCVIRRHKPFLWKSANSDITSGRVHLDCVLDGWTGADVAQPPSTHCRWTCPPVRHVTANHTTPGGVITFYGEGEGEDEDEDEDEGEGEDEDEGEGEGRGEGEDEGEGVPQGSCTAPRPRSACPSRCHWPV